jgi:hypothetical protein
LVITDYVQAADKIVQDAEYYILKAQNAERWAAEDDELDKKLAELKKKQGTPPNIVYILWDDTAFGAVGHPCCCIDWKASGTARYGCGWYAP